MSLELFSEFTNDIGNQIAYQICFNRVSENGLDIESIPNRLIDQAMCIAAVKNNLKSIHVIPNKFKTVELFKAILENYPVDGMSHVPKELRSLI